MNKWDFNNPFVHSHLQKALLGYYAVNGLPLEQQVIDQLQPYFDFEPRAFYARGAATIFPHPSGLIQNILNCRFKKLSENDVLSILEDHNIASKALNPDIKLGISLLGPEVLRQSYSVALVVNYFIPNFAKAFSIQVSNKWPQFI